MPKHPSGPVRLVMITFRVVLLTVLAMALGMGLGLFVGIFLTMIGSGVRHTNPDMTLAYRTFALPTAIAFGSVVLLYQLALEIKSAFTARS